MKGKKITSILVIAVLLLTTLAIATQVSAELPEGFTLGAKNDAYAEWSTDYNKTGDYSVLLETTGEGYPPTADESSIEIPMPEGFTLGDIDTISWWTYLVSGYMPHVDIVVDYDGDGEPDDVINAEGAHQNADSAVGWDTGKWLNTFENASGIYTGWAGIPGSQTSTEVKSVQNKTAVWMIAANDANFGLDTLAKFKDGKTDGSIIVNSSTPVLALVFEVDNWISQTKAYIDDITINGVTYELEFEAGEPVDTIVKGWGLIEIPDANTTVEYEATDYVTITVEDLAENEVETTTFGAVGSYVDVKIDNATRVDYIYIWIDYDDPEDIVGLVEEDLIMYWYDGTDWRACSDNYVDTSDDYIEVYIDDTTSPSLSDLTGTPFGPGGGISLDAEIYATGAVIEVSVGDSDANDDPIRIDKIEVEANSTTDEVGILVELSETGVDTGVFSGSFPTTGEIPPPVDYLAVEDGDTIIVLYANDMISDSAVIDDGSPGIIVTSPPEDIIGENETDVSGTFDEPNIDTVTVNGVEAVLGTGTFTASDVPLLYGNNTLTAVALDLSGHTNSSSTWIVSDTMGPAMTTDALATPLKAIAGGDTVLSVNFTDAWVDVAGVTVNLTAIGGSVDQTILFNITGSGLYEYNATVGALIEDGVYNLEITATDDLDNVNDEEYFLFEVVTDDIPPVIDSWTVEYPFGKLSARVNDTIEVTVFVTDIPAGVSTVVINGTEIGDVAGISMDSIDTDEYLAILTVGAGISDGLYYLNVTAADYAGNEAWTLVEVSILEAKQAYEVGLNDGWNLFSMPLIPDDSSIEVVLADIAADVKSVWSYDTFTGWSSYAPGAPSDLTAMVDGKGYWIDMEADASLVVNGAELPEPPTMPPEYDLFVGWNLMGYKGTTTTSADDYLGSAIEDCERIWAFYGGSYHNVEFTAAGMVPGRGYWIAMSEEGTIYP